MVKVRKSEAHFVGELPVSPYPWRMITVLDMIIFTDGHNEPYYAWLGEENPTIKPLKSVVDKKK